MRVIIAGGRNFTDYEKLERECSQILFPPDEPIEIVSGCARGADELGIRFAKATKIPVKMFPANWTMYGRSAGHRRNAEMANYAKEDGGMLIAFWDGKSKGTENMINLAKFQGLDTFVVRY